MTEIDVSDSSILTNVIVYWKEVPTLHGVQYVNYNYYTWLYGCQVVIILYISSLFAGN